jgi:hypothetical protein
MKKKLTIKDVVLAAIAVYLGSCYVKGNLNVFEFTITERMAQIFLFIFILWAFSYIKIMQDE